MKLNDLFNLPGAKKSSKRLGRGIGSGVGKTSGKGHKGQKARSGVAISANANTFEGGQMPIIRRLPKRGFNSLNRQEYNIVNLDCLNLFFENIVDKNQVVDKDFLQKNGLVKKNKLPIKLLAKGVISFALNIHVDKASSSAVNAVEHAGGKVVLISQA